MTLGRKIYLFVGSNSGYERAATFYSLIGTAELNGIDPEYYVRTVLMLSADHPVNRINELLPWNLIPAAKADDPPKPPDRYPPKCPPKNRWTLRPISP